MPSKCKNKREGDFLIIVPLQAIATAKYVISCGKTRMSAKCSNMKNAQAEYAKVRTLRLLVKYVNL